MSRARKGAASEVRVPAHQEVAVNPFFMEKLRKTVNELKEDNKELNDRLQALEMKQQRFPVTGS